MPSRMPVEKRLELRKLYWAGVRPQEIMARVGCADSVIWKLIQKFPWKPRDRNPRNLSLAEREEISLGLSRNESLRSIARRLGRAPSTISREVAAFGSKYRAFLGDERAERLMARPKPKKLASSPRLRDFVVRGLEQKWSPAQIVLRLLLAYPDDPTMRISPETIYQALYVQGRGSLRQELKKHLRQRRPKRRSQSPLVAKPRPGRLRDMVNISARPAEVADRAVPGHWEGDLIIGKNQKSAIGTLVERATRYVMLIHLPKGWSAEEVRKALTTKIQQLPVELRRSLTWDQGHELAQHAKFTVDTGVDVYFCDPHSPWQRGSNENTNGLLRQYFPKSTDLAKHTESRLDEVARELNGRPRQTLGGYTPAEKFNELLKAA